MSLFTDSSEPCKKHSLSLLLWAEECVWNQLTILNARRYFIWEPCDTFVLSGQLCQRGLPKLLPSCSLQGDPCPLQFCPISCWRTTPRVAGPPTSVGWGPLLRSTRSCLPVGLSRRVPGLRQAKARPECAGGPGAETPVTEGTRGGPARVPAQTGRIEGGAGSCTSPTAPTPAW